MTAPPLAYGNFYRVIALLSMCVWLLFEMLKSSGILRRPSARTILIIYFVIYTSVITYSYEGISGLVSKIQLLVFLFFIIMHDAYRREGFDKLKIVFTVTLTLMPIWLLQTFLALIENGHIARFLIRSSQEAVEYSNSGIGGFGLIYSGLTYFTCLFAFLKFKLLNYKTDKIIIGLIILNTILSFIVIFKSEYSTALILLILMTSFVLFIKKGEGRNNIVRIIAIVIFIVVVIFNLNDILIQVADFFIGTNYHLKITDILSALSAGEGGTVDGRFFRYARSLVLFLDNIMFGTLSRDSVGKHSLILDTFAQFGVFIGFILCYLIFSIPYHAFNKEKKLFLLTFPVFVSIVFLCFLNNIAMSFGYIFFIFYPYLLHKLKYE